MTGWEGAGADAFCDPHAPASTRTTAALSDGHPRTHARATVTLTRSCCKKIDGAARLVEHCTPRDRVADRRCAWRIRTCNSSIRPPRWISSASPPTSGPASTAHADRAVLSDQDAVAFEQSFVAGVGDGNFRQAPGADATEVELWIDFGARLTDNRTSLQASQQRAIQKNFISLLSLMEYTVGHGGNSVSASEVRRLVSDEKVMSIFWSGATSSLLQPRLLGSMKRYRASFLQYVGSDTLPTPAWWEEQSVSGAGNGPDQG